MKKIILAVLLTSVLLPVNASIKFGLRAGVSSSSIKSKYFVITTQDNKYALSNGDSKIGVHGGVMAQISLLNFYFQPELLINHARGEYILGDIVAKKDTYISQSYTSLSVPMVVGFKFSALRIGAGPVAFKNISSSSEFKEVFTTNPADQAVNSFSWGYQVGIGLDLGKMAFDLKYEAGLNAFGETLNVGSSSYKLDARPKQLMFSLGFYF